MIFSALLYKPPPLRAQVHVVGDTPTAEAYCRSLDAAVLATDAFIEALRREGGDGLAEQFSDQGRHVLRGRAEPIHLYGVRRSELPQFPQEHRP